MEDIDENEIKKMKLSGRDRIKLETVKKRAIPGRELKLRSGKAQGVRYYLDANESIKDQACYNIKIDGKKVSARLKKF
jgi:hypothetical protein